MFPTVIVKTWEGNDSHDPYLLSIVGQSIGDKLG